MQVVTDSPVKREDSNSMALTNRRHGNRAPQDPVRDPEYRLTPEQRKIWAASVAGAGIASPVLLSALTMLQPYRSKIVDVTAIDQDWRVAVGDTFFQYPQHEREAIIIHECLHVTCNHFSRARIDGQSNQEISNVAEDLEINQMVASLRRVRLPEGALYPKCASAPQGVGLIDVPPGQLMESYYRMISNGHGMDDMKREMQKQQAKADQNSQDEDQSRPQSGGSDESQGQDQNQSRDSNQPSQKQDDSNSSNSDGGSSSSIPFPTPNGMPSPDGSPQSRRQEGNDPQDQGDASANTGEYNSKSNTNRDQNPQNNTNNPPVDQPSSTDSSGSDSDSGRSGGGDSSNGDGRFGRFGDMDDPSFGDPFSNPDDVDGGGQRKVAGLCGNGEIDRVRDEADKAGVRKVRPASKSKATEQMLDEMAKSIKMNGRPGSSTLDQTFLVMLDKVIHPPELNWRSLLRTTASDLMSKQAYQKTEYSFKRVNRRGSAFMKDCAFPSMIGYAPLVMMAIDTSGSRVDGEQFVVDMQNASDILKAVGKLSKNSFSAFCVDTDVKKIQPVNRVEDLDFTGGGGTDMSVAFRYVRDLPRRKRPDVFVLATDGGFDWDKCAKVWPDNMKVIILITDAWYLQPGKIPEWVYGEAKVIDCSMKHNQ